MIELIGDAGRKQEIARGILEALRDWFGLDESRERYIADSAGWMFFAAREDDKYTGFLCLKETGRQTVELAVMGILREYHRNGLGRALFQEARKVAAKEGYIKESDIARLMKFRSNPSDESWREM